MSVRRPLLVVLLATAVTTGCAGTEAARQHPAEPTAATVRPLPSGAPGEFLAVSYDDGYRGLDLRDSRDGRLVRSLLPARYFAVSAAVTPDGSVLAAATTGRCATRAAAWTTNGVVTAEACAPQQPFSPTRLVSLSPEGRVRHTWSLPQCGNGMWLHTDASGRHLLMGLQVGYGNGACGATSYERVAEVTPTALRPVADVPGMNPPWWPAGW